LKHSPSEAVPVCENSKRFVS